MKGELISLLFSWPTGWETLISGLLITISISPLKTQVLIIMEIQGLWISIMFLFPVPAWSLMPDKLQSDWKNKGLPPFVNKEWKILDLTLFSLSGLRLAAVTCTLLHILWLCWFSGRQRVFLFSCTEWSLQFTTPVWCSGFVHGRQQHVAAHWPFSPLKPKCQVFRTTSSPATECTLCLVHAIDPSPIYALASAEEARCNY